MGQPTWPEPPPGWHSAPPGSTPSGEAEEVRRHGAGSYFGRRVALQALGFDPEAAPRQHPVVKGLPRAIDPKALGGKPRPHELGPFVLARAADFEEENDRLIADVEKLKAAGLAAELPLVIAVPPLKERRLLLEPEQLRDFAAYLIRCKGGDPERLLRVQKPGRRTDPEADQIRAEVCWELNKMHGVSRRELAELFGAGSKTGRISKAGVTWLVNQGRPPRA